MNIKVIIEINSWNVSVDKKQIILILRKLRILEYWFCAELIGYFDAIWQEICSKNVLLSKLC